MGLLTALRNLCSFSPANRRRTPSIMQQEAAECGAACLAMVLAHYGRWVSLESLREQCGVSRDGSKASSLVLTAERHGLVSRGFSLDLHDLKGLPFPFIAFWGFNHFVVVEGLSSSRAWLNDPATGPRTVPMEEFDASFTGVALAFAPGPDFRREGARPGLASLILRNLRGVRKGLVFALCAGGGLIIPGVIIAGANRIFVDDILVKGERDWLIPLLAGLIVSALVTGLLTWWQKFALARTETALAATLGVRTLWSILSLPVTYFGQRFAGDIANRVTQAERMAQLISSGLAPALIGILSILGYGAALFVMDPVVAALVVLVAALAMLLLSLSARSLEDASRRSLNSESRLYGLTMQGLTMREDFRATGAEGMFLRRWFAAQAGVLSNEQQATLRTSLLNESAGFLIGLVGVVVLVAGGLRVMDGALTIGMLMGIQMLAGSFTGPVLSLVGVGAQLQSIRGISERLADALEAAPPPTSAASDPMSPPQGPLASPDPQLETTPLSLRGVSFAYSPVTPLVIGGFSLRLGQGVRAALVGPSGSGKSTLGQIMVGLRQATEGEVRVFGRRIEDWPRNFLSREIAYVDQNVCLFEGAIKDNITLWDETMPEENYVRAAQDAMVHHVITSRPGGYHARLLEGGRNLSGGERQRLALARAFAANPRILVLDEATSALDPVLEKAVMDSVRRRGASCILIAHRISTIRDCDVILVLDGGRVVEHGTHQELMAAGGLYRDLVEH